MPLGMLVTWTASSTVIRTGRKGKTTWIFADEFYLLFRYQYSADFFSTGSTRESVNTMICHRFNAECGGTF